jgi:hypothetical protein
VRRRTNLPACSRLVPGLLLVALAVLACGAGVATGERTRKGDVTVFLDGEISPLALPRDRPAPIAIHLRGGMERAGDGVLPRVTRLELGLPEQGTLSTRGLPVCPRRRLQDARPAEALAACGPALVGMGRLRAQVHIPPQEPFEILARLRAFNGRVGGRRAVILHAYARNPPTVVVLPFLISHQRGRFGLVLAADLPRALGPWPRVARFELDLSRHYSFRGRPHSYLSASCPIPRRQTAGFVSLAQVTFHLANGRRISSGIARSCRAR